MKVALRSLLMLISGFIAVSGAFAGVITVRTEKDWKDVQENAARMHKLILIDFYTDWCVPCKKLDKEVFADSSALDEISKDYYLVKVNAEKEYGITLKSQYEIAAYPTFICLDYTAIPFYSFIGYANKKSFIDELNLAKEKLRNDKPLSYYSGLFNEGKRDAGFVRTYAEKLANNRADSTLHEVLTAYFKDLKPTGFSQEDNQLLVAYYVKNCADPLFIHLEKAHFSKHENTKDGLMINRSYSNALKRCAKLAESKQDTSLLNLTLQYIGRDSLNLDAKETAVKTKLSYYKNTKQYDLYFDYLRKRMNAQLGMTYQDFEQTAAAQCKRMFKEKPLSASQESEFIKKLAETSLNNLANDLNQSAAIVAKERADRKTLEEALQWATRACTIRQSAEFYQTKAAVYRRLNKKEEAIQEMKKAIGVADKSEIPDLEKELHELENAG